LQGIEEAARELGLADASVKVFYHYTGDFAETDANKAVAKGMIQSGAQVIFGCGGAVGKSVFAAAAEGNIKSIGVDVNQKGDSETVITSAMKDLSTSVQKVLAAIYEEQFDTYGGKTTYFSAANDGVGLPDDYERFTLFTKADYEAIFSKLADGTISPIRAIEVDDTAAVTAEQLQEKLGLKKVVVEKR
jgi:basic membrane protein A